ncbi:MAG: hypothetical protein TREMPRED_003416 [Tremellales sp. Tagirdzhanova-0007]|nr:MAG: hypothetical protein TREMPRED_003416 [Tremellales sp. Tagirdzhanova-0007]
MPLRADGHLPATNDAYGTREEHRYASEPVGTSFDWFLSPELLVPIFDELSEGAGTEIKILMLGCGNSALSEAVYEAGWRNIVNVDVWAGAQYSSTVISDMKGRHSELRPEMTWLEMDVLDLVFEKEQFDLVVDKGE